MLAALKRFASFLSTAVIMAAALVPAQGAALVDLVEKAPPHFGLTSGQPAPAGLRLAVVRDGERFRYTVRNETAEPVAIREIVIADVAHGFPAAAGFYGEGFSMFCSTAGTVGQMVNVDRHTDASHYKLPVTEGFRTVYDYFRVTPAGGDSTLVGFSSCRRFTGKFNLNAERLQIVLLTEDLTLAPGAQWELEELVVASGPEAAALLERFAQRIETHHPRLAWPRIPNGWCSWYCYGANISSDAIRANLTAFRQHLPEVRYIQIDDGYEPQIGDWLESTDKFAGGVQQVIREIREAGFEPAIWVAPFAASPGAKLFRAHPDWFVRGDDGQPLSSAAVTFGGWRQGPWYMLDGSHPGAQAYLEHVFRTMRGWGCTYFKLDANIWGSLPFGRRFDPNATSVEAYRRGMEAVRRGAGGDSYLLGCNHAYWPSLGMIHGSRTSFDILRNAGAITRVARENLLRNWMNDRLWWNDPDCFLIPDLQKARFGLDLAGPDGKPRDQQQVTPEQFSFHAAATYATGGMVLSGDTVVDYTPAQWALLRKALARPAVAARFETDQLETGWIDAPGRRVVVLLNWQNAPATRFVRLGGSLAAGMPVRVTDYWTEERVGDYTADFPIELPAGAGRVLVIEPLRAASDRARR